MTLLWRIKPRNWHDGRAVTCGDYVFSHIVARNGQVPVPVPRTITERIANISCPRGPDGTEILAVWNRRYAYANTFVNEFGPLPRHVLEPYYRSNPTRLDETPYGHDPRATIGDGAFQVVEWRRAESLTVEATARHPIFGTPRIRWIKWRFMPSGALVASMTSGAIDAVSSVSIGIGKAVELERMAKDRVKVFFEPGPIWEHVDFNLDNPLLQDVRIRRAIAHGINRPQIVQQFFQGRYPVAHTYLPLKHSGFTDVVQKYPYNPVRARELLQQAGFGPGPDGILRNTSGQRLSLELSTTAGKPIREGDERAIQEQLRQLGIEVTVLNFPPRLFFGEFTDRRKFKALTMYAWIMNPESECNLLYTLSDIPSETNGWRGQNLPGYRNAEMGRVCTAASREVDETRRNSLLNESARIFSRDLPALPLYFGATVAAAKVGLRNFIPSGLRWPGEMWNVYQWYWE